MPKTVMIVEDFADTRELMKIFVEHFGYLVIEAADGSEAVEKTKQYHPDLILMDLAMPFMDGATATKIIRADEEAGKVSIIALTAFNNVSYQKAIDIGFDGILHKPLQFECLEPVLNHYLA